MNPSKKAGKKGKVIGYVAAKDLTLGDMIAWMQGCAKDAKCEDKKIQREVRQGYAKLTEVLKWAKDHGCPVGVICDKARGSSPAPDAKAKAKGVKCPKCGGKARPAGGMSEVFTWCDKCGFQRPEDQ